MMQWTGGQRGRWEVIEILHRRDVPHVHRVILETCDNHITQGQKEHLQTERERECVCVSVCVRAREGVCKRERF